MGYGVIFKTGFDLGKCILEIRSGNQFKPVLGGFKLFKEMALY